MNRVLWRMSLLAIVMCGAFFCLTAGTHAQNAADEAVRIAGKKIGDANPEVRAQAVSDLARANNREGANLVLQCLAAETDGPAGFSMAQSVSQLTSEEALETIEKTILKWNKPENLFGAYWTFIGLSAQNGEAANAILRKAIEDSRDDDIYLRSAAIEAMAETGRADMGDLLLKVLKSYDPAWDEKAPIYVLTAIRAAPKMVSESKRQLRNDVVLALADVLEKSKDDRIQWFTCTALSTITGEDTYIEPGFWRWWVEVGGRKVERREEGETVAGRDVPKFFKAAAVGKRVMFVIDVSGSMSAPVELPPEMKKPPEPQPKKDSGPVTGGKSSGKNAGKEDGEKKAEMPPPDYSRVKTKMDLAKVELIHSLKHLPGDYWFNVVVYHTPHQWIDQSNDEFVPATDANKKKFIKKVEALAPLELTNIYGGLIRGFCASMRGSIDPAKLGKKGINDPAWDPECLKSGATTMFFLTDGSPTVTDDTIDDVRSGRMAQGEARYCRYENILLDIKRVNTFRKVVINTIGIGPHDGRLMEALARMTGGEYIDRSGLAPR